MRLGGWACRRCHTYLHARLAAGGIDLRRAELVPAVRAWAVTRGTSETIAAALVVLDQPCRRRAARPARAVGQLLAAPQPVCEALSPRPLVGRAAPAPIKAHPTPRPIRRRHVQAVLDLARPAATVFDDEEERWPTTSR